MIATKSGSERWFLFAKATRFEISWKHTHRYNSPPFCSPLHEQVGRPAPLRQSPSNRAGPRPIGWRGQSSMCLNSVTLRKKFFAGGGNIPNEAGTTVRLRELCLLAHGIHVPRRRPASSRHIPSSRALISSSDPPRSLSTGRRTPGSRPGPSSRPTGDCTLTAPPDGARTSPRAVEERERTVVRVDQHLQAFPVAELHERHRAVAKAEVRHFRLHRCPAEHHCLGAPVELAGSPYRT